ncbi:MAG: response regulator [Desulfuromonadaceae bacterium]|nr:response regulator [Desulfuromonadaceae bacterium]
MSLAGKLEELGLGEILQIVSLSRKTGVLFLSSGGMDGSVFFRQGQVVRASSSSCHKSLGEELILRGVIDLPVLRKALAYQQEYGFRERLGVILVKKYVVSQSAVDEVVREQIENVVFSLFAWTEGTFTFEVRSSVEAVDETKMDPLQFMLDQGLNPQFLAMEGMRLADEKRRAAEMARSGADVPDQSMDFDFDLVESPHSAASSHHEVPQPLVIVDDDGPTLRAIADGLAQNGFTVHALTRSEDTLIKVDALYRSGNTPVVLIDLIMPKMDGSGVLGGIELMELLHNNFKDIQLIVMTDYHHEDAENRICDLGYSFTVKPRRVEINNPAVMGSFLTQIVNEIRSSTEAVADRPPQQSQFNLGDELRIEMGDDDDMPSAVKSPQQNGGFSLLRGMLEELNNPDLQGGILLLILRFASEFLNRAIVFTIHEQVVSGFGQFGVLDGTVSGDDRVRSIHFTQDSGSMFDESIRSGQSRIFSPLPTPVDMHIFEQLGGGTPSEVFIGPLVSRSRVFGVLYGDNLPEKKPVGDLESLAIFLSQAGISMEKSVLERQLNERGIS